ncbi:serine hydrolase domain-containing protein [Sphingosinicella rhizophila]|uniref:Serine hydrolase domain-containing protein n=1 Tax=Sphingosinicella rhizophila TaxID=3050082 RepID=A0ABU3Q5N2_9SPHN|nr:serine hydrolase domain-containing protein [Sphingosinicella sp. GR2756]MDT9598715.1 serine hydrolase domain-containing protein [Sphingosinicella sp. GR2756]
MTSLTAIGERLQAVLDDRSSKGDVAGAVVGISIGDEQLVLAHGSANLNTGQPFTEDTGFLLGSVTKVLVTTALLRFVERGLVDLDAPVKRYLPDFVLSDRDAAERITVRMLVNHTNGIDSDTLCPASVRGRDATRHYMTYLAKLGVLFEPGTSLTYSNPGFVIAARIMEELTGTPFERAIQTELFDPAGMRDATALQTQAFLRRTAVGAFISPDTGELKASHVFTLGEGLAGGGTTLIVSPQDMLAFGRMHLKGGLAADGTRVLGDELVTAMRTTSFDLGIPQAPPMGLGWWAYPIAGTTAYHHAGGSPGGTSSFCIIPEYDAVIISFATGPGTGPLQDELHNAAIEELTGRSVVPPFEPDPQPIPADLAGEYRSFQHHARVEVKGDELLLTMRYQPCDEEHREFFKDMFSTTRFPPVTYRSIAPGQFLAVGAEPKDYSGFLGRSSKLLAALPATPARCMGLHTILRYTPKISG